MAAGVASQQGCVILLAAPLLSALVVQDRENPRYVQHVGKRFSQTYLRRASQRKNRASGGSSMPRAVLWLDRDWNHTTDPCDG
jgi:hypothetical protein